MSDVRKCLSCARKGYSVGETTKDVCPYCYSPTLKYDDFIKAIGDNSEKVTTYEFFIFEGNQTMMDRDVEKMQSKGWELAGSVAVKFSDQPAGMPRILVPLKRKLV